MCMRYKAHDYVFTLAPAFFGEGFATEVVVTGKRSPSRQYLTDAVPRLSASEHHAREYQ